MKPLNGILARHGDDIAHILRSREVKKNAMLTLRVTEDELKDLEAEADTLSKQTGFKITVSDIVRKRLFPAK